MVKVNKKYTKLVDFDQYSLDDLMQLCDKFGKLHGGVRISVNQLINLAVESLDNKLSERLKEQ